MNRPLVKISALVVLCALLLTPALAFVAQADGHRDQYREEVMNIIMPSVRLRSTPSTSGRTVETLSAGAPVQVDKVDGSWCKVGTQNGNEGWVPVSYVGRVLYTIRFLERTKGYHWRGANSEKFGACAFDVEKEDALVLWEEDGWMFVVTESGRSGYVAPDAEYEIADDGAGAESLNEDAAG